MVVTPYVVFKKTLLAGCSDILCQETVRHSQNFPGILGVLWAVGHHIRFFQFTISMVQNEHKHIAKRRKSTLQFPKHDLSLESRLEVGDYPYIAPQRG